MNRLAQLFTLFFVFSAPVAYAAMTQDSFPDVVEYVRQTQLTIRPQQVNLEGIPRGATHVPLLPLRLTASCEGDVQLRTLHVRRAGLGDPKDVSRVYLVEGFKRLTRSTRFSSDDQMAVLRLRNFVIPACETREIVVTVDFRVNAAVGGEFRLTVQAENNVVADADILVADFPIQVTPLQQTITPQPNGVTTITFLKIPGTIRAVRDEVLAKFRIEADSDAHQILHAITLTNKGTASGDDLRNLYITRRGGGRAVTPIVKRLDGDQVTLRFFSPYFIRRGQKVMFNLMGNAYTSRKTVNFTLEEPSDLMARPSKRSGRQLGGGSR